MKKHCLKILFSIGVFLEAVGHSGAQDSFKEKLPEGPLIQKIPVNAAWTITLVSPDLLRPKASGALSTVNTNAASVPEDGAEIVKWSFSRAGKTAHLEMLARNRGITSIWALSPSPLAVKTPSDNNYHIVELGDELSELGYGNNTFPHTSLVAPQNFAGRLAVNGSPVLVFKRGDGTGADSGMVLIDEKTRFPYGVIENQKGFLFSYQPSTTVLVPPKEVISVFQNEKARLDRLNAVPPHP